MSNFQIIDVRPQFLLLTTALVSSALFAADPIQEYAASIVDASVVSPDVVVTPIQMPLPVRELLQPVNPAKTLKTARKAKASKALAVASLPLSRTERHQLALLSPGPKVEKYRFALSDDSDAPADFDELAIHVSYSRPRLKSDDPQDNPLDALPAPSDTARVRLLFARLKALEAHAMGQAPDDGAPLPGNVQQRLAEARHQALARHQAIFG